MSARSRALVPLSTEQQAAWRAVAETEKRRHQGNTLAVAGYAVLAGHRRGWYGGKGGRSCRP
ncbi:hypothetical protein GSA15_004875 [Salmonella enterica]|nr:hypothetical protein [Salmonella enterica]